VLRPEIIEQRGGWYRILTVRAMCGIGMISYRAPSNVAIRRCHSCGHAQLSSTPWNTRTGNPVSLTSKVVS
jgi:NMD protein affecting ribosome stability and mRNA decay